ncbi:isopeptide-forming domain-containing fimbrial protein [Lampropedia puyangensis]|uniref:Isopeptide-forming domain-containing fimbrial protein n=1 Tax=Lampropedia puyangensis TaxID=1330072 RepID=A0A4S8F8P1_9BURK|nr:isopeptide-forming domain-containing fimbrial protein [Lampropedia puyangensis]THU03978.1 isopeptide-forming domain-containing fimbrial protein [Lampropedia puyangensis]
MRLISSPARGAVKSWALALIGTAMMASASSAIAQTAPKPVFDIETQPGSQLLGESFCYNTTINNQGGADTGYGPYVLVEVPKGLTLDSASIFEQAAAPVNLQSISPNNTPVGHVVDPWSGQDFDVANGSTVYRIVYPVGSVVAGGPDLEMQVCGTIASDALLGVPLTIEHTPIYRYGDEATGNTPITGDVATAQVVPSVMVLTKSHSAPENERTPGPSWDFDYILTANIANGAAVSGITFSDVLPSSFQYVEHAITGGGNCSITATPSSSTPGGTLTVSCPGQVTGTSATDDIQVRITGHLIQPEAIAQCTTTSVENRATLDGAFRSQSLPQQNADARLLTGKHVALQKSASTTQVNPGQELTYTINGQVTDYSDATGLIITDILDDGLEYIETLQNDAEAEVSYNPSTRTISFDLSSKTLPKGQAFTLTYRAKVAQYYSNGQPVLANDTLENRLSSTYALTNPGSAVSCNEDSAASVMVTPVTISKTVTNPKPSGFLPGDTVTYRLKMDIAAGSTKDVVMTDYLPLPVFRVADISIANDVKVISQPAGSPAPTITPDAATNSLRLTWPQITSQTASTIVVEIDAKVTSSPFADELHLTNLFQASTENTKDLSELELKPDQVGVTARAPLLTLDKTITNAPGNTGWEAGNTVNYKITMANTGGSTAYQIRLTDDWAQVAGLTNCGGPTPSVPTSLAANASVDLLYTCTIADSVSPDAVVTNNASVLYKSVDSTTAPDYPNVKDSASLRIANLVLTKSIKATSEAHTGGTDVAIGEVVRYRLEVHVPRSTMNTLVLADALHGGLKFQPGTAQWGFNSATGQSIAPTVSGQTLTFTFGGTGMAMPDTTQDATDQTLWVEFDALVLNKNTNNASANSNGNERQNLFSASINGGTARDSNNAPITIREPGVTAEKTIAPNSSRQAGDEVTYTIKVTNSAGRATAFDVVLSDKVPPELELVPGTIKLHLPSGPVQDIADPITPGASFEGLVPVLQASQTAQLTFKAKLPQNIAPGTTVRNTAQTHWTSLPGPKGSGPANGVSATPGATDAPDGERLYTQTPFADLKVTPVDLTKTVSSSSEEHTTGSNMAIGETATYTIVAQVPYGTTPSMKLKDVFSDVGSMQILSASVKSIGANLTVGTPNPQEVISPSKHEVELDFGSVVSRLPAETGNTDPMANAITVEVQARLQDIPTNTNGREITNTVSATYGGTQPATRHATITVVEPQLRISKEADKQVGVAGDLFTYTVTVAHTSASTADATMLVFKDELPSQLVFEPNSLKVLSGPAPTALTSTSNTMEVTFAALPLSSRPNAPITISYQARLIDTIETGRKVTNTAHIDWNSLTDPTAPENGGQNRKYNESNSQTITVSSPGVTKQVLSTSEASTVETPNVLLTTGEQVTYRMVASLPAGTTPSASFKDVLPATVDLGVISSRIVSIGSNLTGANLPAVGTEGVVNGNTISWDLGTIENPPGPNLETAASQIEFEVVAVVKNSSTNLGATPGNNQTNQAVLTFSNVNDPNAAPIEISASAHVRVVHPELEVSKTIVAPSAAANTLPLLEAGEEVHYQITISHRANSSASAQSIAVKDTLPDALEWIGLDATSTSCGTHTITGTPDASDNRLIDFDLSTLALGESCTIVYRTRVVNSALAGHAYTNTASIGWNSLADPSTDPTNNYSQSDDASSRFLINGPAALIKEVVETSLPDTRRSSHQPGMEDLAIGETATYYLTVLPPKGTTLSAVLKDEMPRNANGDLAMQIISARVLSQGKAIRLTPAPAITKANDGSNVEIQLGTIENDYSEPDSEGLIVIEVIGVVLDTPENKDGTILKNNATLHFDDGTPDGQSLTAEAEVALVEPTLGLNKTMVYSTTASASGVVTVTMKADNTGTGPAYAFTVEDTLSAQDWLLDTIELRDKPDGYAISIVEGPQANEKTVVLRRAAGSEAKALLPGESITATFDVQMKMPAVNNPVMNHIDLKAPTSVPGTPSDPKHQRTYGDEEAVASLPVPVLSMSKVATIPGGKTNAEAGDTLEYTLTVSNKGQGAATNVLVTDSLADANLTLVAGSVSASQGTVTTGNATDASTIEVQLGSIAANASATITFNAKVPRPLGATVTAVQNQAVVRSTEQPNTLSDDPSTTATPNDPTIVAIAAQPNLQVRKSGPQQIETGASLVYTLEYANVGDRDAVDVILTETVPAHTRFNSAASDPNWACTNADEAGATCTLTLGAVAGGFATPYGQGQVTFAVNVDSTVPAGTTLIANTATISTTSTDPLQVDSDSTDNSDNWDVPLGSGTGPDLYIHKSTSATTLTPGAVAVYRIDYGNQGNRGATGVVLTETVPENTSFEPSQSDSNWVCANGGGAGQVCTLALQSSIEVQKPDSVEFAVRLDNPLPLDVTDIANTVTIDDDHNNGPDLDPSNNSSTETTPVVIDTALRITKVQTSGVNPVRTPNVELGYTITVENTGNISHTNVVVTDTLPDSSDGTPQLVGPQESINANGILDIGETWTYTIGYTVTADDFNLGEPLVNVASVVTTQSPVPQESSATTPIVKYAEPVPTNAPWALLAMVLMVLAAGCYCSPIGRSSIRR